MTPEPRKCGPCTACCTVLGIAELEKKEHTRCSFLSGAGSAIGRGCLRYEDRPAECGAYRCAWLDGFGGRADRPDDLGVIFDGGANASSGTIIAREVTIGAASGMRASGIIAKLRRTCVVVIATRDGQRHASGPRHLIDALLRLAKRPQ